MDEGLEKGVPKIDERIDTFKKLVNILGKGHVVWRFDPLVLTDNITVSDLLRKIEYIGNNLQGYTEKLVFSYADIASYRKVRANLDANNINYTETLGTHRYEGHTINGKLDGEIYRYDMDMYHPNTLTSVLEYQDGK